MERLVRALSAIPRGSAAGTWALVEAMLGRERAVSMGHRKARHFCERTLEILERTGLARRLPTKLPSSSPFARPGRRLVRKELAWAITDEGVAFLRERSGRGEP